MTARSPGAFIGKLTFSSSSACLAALRLQDGAQKTHWFPAMIAFAKGGSPALVNAYLAADGSVRLQIEKLWIGIDPDAGCLVLVNELAQAATLRLSGLPVGQGWEVLVEGGWLPVVFYPQTSQAILTINASDDAVSRFEPIVVTPSLAMLVASRQGRGADLNHVVLDGARAVGVDFTGARFIGSSLQGADLSDCLLDSADFSEARLDGVSFHGAQLNGARLVGATLAAPGWGLPRSAQGIDLSQCRATGAILGGPSSSLDCAKARLDGGDFTNADLRGLRLQGASLRDATLSGCQMDAAVLDGADLTGVFALKASLRKCSLKNIVAGNANFTAANLSEADLNQAQLDAKVRLFRLPLSLLASLRHGRADMALLAAFRAEGIDLPADAVVLEQVAQRRWQIGGRSAGYALIAMPEGIDVFRLDAALRPAILYRAICSSTRAAGAHLGGADLRGVQWHGDGASLNRADLEGAVLSYSLLVSLDLSQAFLSGADLTGCVLADANMASCTIMSDAGSRAFALDGAQIQGVDFTDTNLVDALLINAGVALDKGVPLFTLPPSTWDDLSPASLAALAPRFALAGYPLGSAPRLDLGSFWLLDNAMDPVASDPRQYSVREIRGQLEVFDAADGGYLFSLPGDALFSLEGEHPDEVLIAEFQQAGFGLSASASITRTMDPVIRPGTNAGISGPFGYASFRLARRERWVQVFGMGPLLMRDWQAYPAGVAFKATRGLAAAMSEHSIGPAGYLKQALTAGVLDSEAFFTAMPRLS